MLIDQYASLIHTAIDRICQTQNEAMAQAAQIAAKVICQDGLIYVFGCGHSHILSEETFYRAGGLACVAPVFCERLMLHESAWESSRLEKESGYARHLLEKYPFTPRDMVFCVSTSGKNAVPVEFAMGLAEKGVPTVAICSGAYADVPVSNPLGKHLYQVCDLWLDNQAPYGDACLSLRWADVPMAPLSTITGSFLINSVLAQATQLALDQGADAPIYLSGNLPGGRERNHQLVERYAARIPHL